jgi:L-aspartate oxidase
MRAGHYENRKESVDIMIRSSAHVIDELIGYGVEFEKDGDTLLYTREGGHSDYRILFHEDVTGQEITGKLLNRAKERDNITIMEHCMMLDIIEEDRICHGVVMKNADGSIETLTADYTVFACGGLGGLYQHSTNFRHITGDALAIALNHDIRLENIDYIQIHPTTLYSKESGRRFLISESVRGEGAILLNKKKERFVDELLPRDLLTKAVREQMKKDDMPYVWLSMEPIPKEEIIGHFPNIYKRCLEEGYDCTKECIPVVPAQHYFMGGIWVDKDSHTSMEHLYAVGETSCNGVHGRNRLASNSLLESLVFAERSAKQMEEKYEKLPALKQTVELDKYTDIQQLGRRYHDEILEEIDRERMAREHE